MTQNTSILSLVLSKYSKSLLALHLYFAPRQRSGVTSYENQLYPDQIEKCDTIALMLVVLEILNCDLPYCCLSTTECIYSDTETKKIFCIAVTVIMTNQAESVFI